MGFCDQPFAYRPPTVILQLGRNRRAEHPRFYLSWPRQEHALAFYAIWNGYHWGSNHFEQVIVINLQNEQWEEAMRNPIMASIRSDPMQATLAPFLQVMGGRPAIRGS